MTVAASIFTGLFVYLLVGRVFGLVSFNAWPGHWRTSPRLPRGARRPGGHLGSASFFIAIAGAAFVGWSLAALATGSPWIGLPAGFLSGGIPLRRRARSRARDLADLQESWPDGLQHLVSSVRSGSTVEAAVLELARTGPDPLRSVFGRFTVLAPAVGVQPALEAVRDAVADPTTDRVVEVLLVAHEVGGRVVPAILDDLATAVAEDLRTVEEIRTAGLEQRLNARIVFAVPWSLLVLLTARPGFYRTFYQSRPGITIVLAAAVLSGIALVVVGRLGIEPLEQRVLAVPEGETA